MDFDITPFLPIISGAVGGATSAGLFKGPIQTFQDWWYVSYGHNQSQAAALLREKQEINIKKLRDEALAETAKISPENIQEPNLNILGPTLEASRYYIEEEELRKMFAKLIASSMDKSKISITHPSFVEIIKQMTPLDAQILDLIINNNQTAPIGRIGIKYPNRGSRIHYDLLFSLNSFMMGGEEQIMGTQYTGPSLENLSRLGLVTNDYTKYMTDASEYTYIQKSVEYMNVMNDIQHLNKNLTDSDPKSSLVEQHGVTEISSFGKAFAYICLGVENSFHPF